jgi:hypothetical protein
MKNNLLKVPFLTVLLTFLSFLASVQPGDPPADPDPLPAPINNQIIWLVVLGIVFAYYIIKRKFLWQNKIQKQENTPNR